MRPIPIALLLVVAALPTLAGADLGCDPDDDAGSGRDASAQAPIPVAPGTYAGCIGIADAESADWFEMTAGPGEQVAFTFVWSDCEAVYARLYRVNPDGTMTMQVGFSANRGCPQWSLVSIQREEATTYRAEFRLRGEAFGNPYTLEAERGTSLGDACLPGDDLGSGRDASWLHPVDITPGSPLARGCLDQLDEVDAYRVTFPEPGPLHLEVRVHGACDFFTVDFLRAGSPPDWIDYHDTPCEDQLYVFEAPEAGEYILRVEATAWYPPHQVLYDIRVQTAPFWTVCDQQNDHGTGRDATEEEPIPALPDERIHACVDEWDRRDTFTVPVTGGEVYEFRVEAEDCRYPYAGIDMGGGRFAGGGKHHCSPTSIWLRAPADATWRIGILADYWNVDAIGPYTVTLRTCPEALPLLPPREACSGGRALADRPALPQGSEGRPCHRESPGFSLLRSCPSLPGGIP